MRNGTDRGSSPENCQNRAQIVPVLLGLCGYSPKLTFSGPPCHLPCGRPPGLRPPWQCCSWQPLRTAVATQQSFICQLNPSETLLGTVKCAAGGGRLRFPMSTTEQHHHMTIMKAHAGCSFRTEVHEPFKTSPPLHRSQLQLPPSPALPCLPRVKFSQGTIGQMLSGVTSFFAKRGPNTTQKLAFTALLLTALTRMAHLQSRQGHHWRLLS